MMETINKNNIDVDSLIIASTTSLIAVLLSSQTNILSLILGGTILTIVMYNINTKFSDWLNK